VLEELKAAEKLPIRVLHPALDHLLVRQVVDMLQVMQPDHQPRRLGGSANRLVEPTERLVKSCPWDHTRQSHQRVARVDDRVQTVAKKIISTGRGTSWPHTKNTRNQLHHRRFTAVSNTSKQMGIP
jgi:hypothetical protein